MFHAKTPPSCPSGNATWAFRPGQAAARRGLGELDFLGRMPVPLRRPFHAGLERVTVPHGLVTEFAMGGEWYAPFNEIPAAADAAALPHMVVTPWSVDAVTARLLRLYPGRPNQTRVDRNAACVAGGVFDPLGVFSVFALIPLVFLVDLVKLGARRPPRRWSDLLDGTLRGEVVFGGWRPNDRQPFKDYNEFLLLALMEEFGADGLRAFAANVKTLQHNVVSARTAGSEHGPGGAVTVLPWMQAAMSPRRAHVSVVWPEDGAYVMPIGYLLKPDQAERLGPVVDFLGGAGLGNILARNCYPATGLGDGGGMPRDGGVKWLGWDYVRSHDVAARAAIAGRLFFESWPCR